MMRMEVRAVMAVVVGIAVVGGTTGFGQEDFIPRRQDKPPGPALKPEEARAKMTVPPGFQVELVAHEPDLVNPVAMTFDERGRVWVTESLEYPRHSPGKGRDRVKVLEDVDGDGKAEKVTIFAEGLNIPSGIAVGHGGVWVANAPDLLFLQDTDGDGKADKSEVVVTGFGRTDTHELPNSLTWGPDGWLYGINGVFNYSHIKYRGKEYKFTCALFRVHPKTRDFELFAEGTSNPWGVAWDNEGSAFFSACVIDHLWHITESGYYHRQGGPYPPYTWKIESIVKHRHQQAAYCGIHFFDSDAYPAKYRDKLYMGNIHGGCVNSDYLERDGSTYFGKPDPDFLTANDVWFMPVVQKTGPDGCLYVLDWYDRYHCYQDANRDPAGIDRLHGRLYRVRYENTPRMVGFDLSKESDAQLIARLALRNDYFRSTAQRILTERLMSDGRAENAALKTALQSLVLGQGEVVAGDAGLSRKARMHGLWALVGGGGLDKDFHLHLLAHADPGFRAWAVRGAGNKKQVDDAVRAKVVEAAKDESPDVRLQAAVAARKVEGIEPIDVLLTALAHSPNDKLIPHIVWQNLHPLLEDQHDDFLAVVQLPEIYNAASVRGLTPRLIERLLGRKDKDPAPVAALFALLSQSKDKTAAAQCLSALAAKVQTRELTGPALAALRPKLEPALRDVLAGPSDSPLFMDAALLAVSWGDPSAMAAVRKVFAEPKTKVEQRLLAFEALVAAHDEQLLSAVDQVLADPKSNPPALRSAVLDSLGRFDAAETADVVLKHYKTMESDLQPKAVELLTQRPAWSKALLAAVAKKDVPASAVNVNQVRRLQASKDPELVKLVTTHWGAVRTERNPQREQVIADMRKLIRATPGDAHRGEAVFHKLCGQCHKMFGKGQEVGPDITVNGRASFEQLLSNVFDPSLVIGAAYQARTVATTEGRLLTGLLAEDSPQRVVLKMQGGKLETIARDDIDEMDVSRLSMMPEDLEKQLKPHEIADLFAFITLDKHPSDPAARQMPGVRRVSPMETTDATKFRDMVEQIAPGFSTLASGVGGVALLGEHQGRDNVLRTHPVDRDKPCSLRSSLTLPAGKKIALALSTSHHSQGDWRLLVKVNGETVHEAVVGPKTVREGWADATIDLTRFAGKTVHLELLNQPTGWAFEFGYWSRVELVVGEP